MQKKMPMMILMLIILTVSFIFVGQGIMMHAEVPEAEQRFNALQQDYWTQNKQLRDAAATDSELNKQLATIHQYPSMLMELKLIGVGKILTGIAVILLGIMIALISMPMRLHMIMMQSKGMKGKKM